MSAANFGSARARCSAMLGFAGPVTEGGRLPLLLASMGINLLGLALPIFILQIDDRVLPNAATTALFALIVGLAVALVLDAVLRALRANVATWNGARFEHLTRYRAVERLLRAPLLQLERQSPGSYLERINAIGSMRDFHASQVLLLAIDLPFALMFLGLIGYLGGWVALRPAAPPVLFRCPAVPRRPSLRAPTGARG